MAVVQNCDPAAYVDVRTAPPSERELAWDFSILANARRCLLIQTGQSVTWTSDLGVHPLAAQGGDTPNPIGFHDEGSAATVTFTSPGTFGYKCQAHSSMIGAVQVVQAPPPGQAPALPVPLVVGLFLALLISGRELLRRRLAQRASARA